MTDGELVRLTLGGQNAAFEELVRRWSAAVLAVCAARVRRQDVAEELAQESLLRGYRGLATLADPERFGAWLRGIATRVSLDWLKSKQTSQVHFTVLTEDGRADELFADPRPGPLDSLAAADETRQLLAAVDDLPEDYRETLLLYYYQDVTYQDLAKLLDVSAATINARLTKARGLLRQRLVNHSPHTLPARERA